MILLELAMATALSQARDLVQAGDFAAAERVVRTAGDTADAHKLLGYILFKENKPKESIAEYLNAGKQQPLGAPEYEVIGSDYFLLENYPAADEWLTRAIQSGDRSAVSFYLLGRARYNERNFAGAVTAFQQSLALDGVASRTWLNLGLAYQQMGRSDDALNAFKRAGADLQIGELLLEQNRPAEALPYLMRAGDAKSLGKAYLLTGKYAEAEQELRAAVAQDAADAPAHFLLAQAERKLGKNAQAAEQEKLYRSLTGDHSSPDDPLSEARALVQSGDLKGAEQRVRAYLTLHQHSPEAHFLLGYILFEQKRATESLAQYTEGAKYRTPSARDLEAVAADYVLLHDYVDADKWFTKAVDWAPDDWDALYYLGRTKYNENRFEEAQAIFEHCLKLKPQSVKAEDNLGLTFEGMGKTDQAIAAYKQAIAWQSENEKNADPYLNLGALLVGQNEPEQAIAYLRTGLGIAPKDVRAHRELGKALLRAGKLDEAQSELEKVELQTPDDVSIHFLLAQVYRKRGLTTKAQAELALCSKLSAGNAQ